MKERFQDIIHKRLEGFLCVGQAEGHDQELEVAVVCMEYYPLHICWVHTNLMIPAMNIQLGEGPSAFQLLKKLVNDQN